ncbi:hypothetical protein JYT94_00115 [bacterium AH-315-P11]|nr:hypothetical protein [bacterium AH-315-P11]
MLPNGLSADCATLSGLVQLGKAVAITQYTGRHLDKTPIEAKSGNWTVVNMKKSGK